MVRIQRAALAILAMAGLSLSAASSRAADEKLLPGNAEAIFTLNIKQILNSEVVKAQKDVLEQIKAAVASQIPGEDRAQKYLEKLGFDPFRDLTSLTLAHPGSKDADALFVIVEGAFNTQKFEATAEEAAKDNGDSLKISKMGTAKVYEIIPPGEKRIFASMFGGKSLVLTPSQSLLKEVLERNAETPKTIKKELRDLLKTTNDKQSMSFVITGAALSRLAENAPNVPNAQMIGPALKAIDGLSGAVTIGKNINFQLGIGSKDEPNAKQMAAAGNAALFGLRVLAAQEAKKNADFSALTDVANTLRISNVGTSVVVTGEISYENLEKLIKSVNKLKQ